MRPHSVSEVADAGAAIHACWNSIGVRGDKSCPELAGHAHCRNCPAFSAAAVSLLDRERSSEAPLAGAEVAAARNHGAEQPPERSAIMFRIGQEWFALATRLLDEVTEMRVLHALPHRRGPVVLGIVNVRGELVVCVSLGRLLGIAEDTGPPGRRRRLLVIRGTGGRLAAPVDEVQHTHRYHDSALIPPPATVMRSETSFTRGLLAWGERTASSLHEDRLLEALDRSLS